MRPLQLNELVLGSSDAYGSDGEFLGWYFAGTANTFSADAPGHVHVLGTGDEREMPDRCQVPSSH